ncbi:putative RNA-directed DNA polymerase [Helianthus annuus]|nr:putative RNA-directed DNA polymerase [Helianthus annuus]KAJ0926922.1 putative RNA-directed DNA polymerase [Helianthus annuus]
MFTEETCHPIPSTRGPSSAMPSPPTSGPPPTNPSALPIFEPLVSSAYYDMDQPSSSAPLSSAEPSSAQSSGSSAESSAHSSSASAGSPTHSALDDSFSAEPSSAHSFVPDDEPADEFINAGPSNPDVSPPEVPVPPSSSQSVHSMQTRSKSGIFKPKHQADFASLSTYALHAALVSAKEPRGFKSAAKDPQWMAAMHDEIQALQQNCTWTLVPRPATTNVVGSMWVYCIKYHSDGSVERYKARLVAQGFTQIPGLDFSHTFSLVVKASTVRIVLSLVILNNWKLHQLDVKNAFLNGNLNETVFMEQPPGFVDTRFPNHVCKLSKALYALNKRLVHGFIV